MCREEDHMHVVAINHVEGSVSGLHKKCTGQIMNQPLLSGRYLTWNLYLPLALDILVSVGSN